MSLDTGKRIHGHQLDELAITDEVIERDENGIPKLGMSPENNIFMDDTDILN